MTVLHVTFVGITLCRVVALVVYAKSPETVANFYASIFSMHRADVDGGSFTLTGPDFEIHVVGVPREIAQEITLSSPPVPREETPLKFSMEVPDVDAVAATALALGSQVHGASWTWNARRHVDLVDPEGNVFQVFEAVP
jgi:predicted enzyme related to lactoylglutathione lyase